MAKAVGIGGVLLKARAPEKLAGWYAAHLGTSYWLSWRQRG
jgi:proteasome lid subunit RPN8/RPN11